MLSPIYPWHSRIARQTPTFKVAKGKNSRWLFLHKALRPKQGDDRAAPRATVGDYATAVAKVRILRRKQSFFYPWHSWIARQTPTLKVEGSNPFG